VLDGFGTAHARPIRRATPESLRRLGLPAGSMGPKVEAAARFVTATGGRTAIGALADAPALVAGSAGTLVERSGTNALRISGLSAPARTAR
jgi:carbamate kinase